MRAGLHGWKNFGKIVNYTEISILEKTNKTLKRRFTSAIERNLSRKDENIVTEEKRVEWLTKKQDYFFFQKEIQPLS